MHNSVSWFFRAASPLLLSLMISGCAAVSTRVSDELTLENLQKDDTGVGIIQMGLSGARCPGGYLIIGSQVEGGYRPVETLLMRDNFIDRGVPPQVKLKPGTYHVIAWGCHRGNFHQSVGKRNTNFFWEKGRFANSFASFTINPGEIVNVGMLRMHSIPGTEKVLFQITDLPPDLHAGLKKTRPKLYAQMTTRLMKINSEGLTDKQRQARCKILKLLQAPGQKSELPAGCAKV